MDDKQSGLPKPDASSRCGADCLQRLQSGGGRRRAGRSAKHCHPRRSARGACLAAAAARQLCERDGQWQPGDAAQQRLSGAKAGPHALPAPQAPRVSQGAVSGTLNAAASPVYGASAYNWSVALESAPDKDVQSAQTTGARASFSGLTPGQVYVVSLNAVGAAGVSDWSDYGSLMVI